MLPGIVVAAILSTEIIVAWLLLRALVLQCRQHTTYIVAMFSQEPLKKWMEHISFISLSLQISIQYIKLYENTI